MKILVIDPATTTVAEIRYCLETVDLTQYDRFIIGSLASAEAEALYDLLLWADEDVEHFTDDRPVGWQPRPGFEFEGALHLDKVPAQQLLHFMEAHLDPFQGALNKAAKAALCEMPECIPEPKPRQPERFKGYQSTRRKYK